MIHQSVLAAPLQLAAGIAIRNRFLKSATSEQMGDKHRNPRPSLAQLYRAWSAGGVGLAVSGNLMVDRNALGEPLNVVLDEYSKLDLFKEWASEATRDGMHLWAQINHPGKQSPSIISREPVAPSAIPLGGGLEGMFNMPRELTDTEIQELVKKYALTARLAKDAGFTGVQIHGAHGYLVSQFLSPRHNQRTDQWGGELQNRMRFVLEIYKAVREQVGGRYPVSIKLNSADFQKDGFSEQDSMAVIRTLSSVGIDFIEISGGTYEAPVMSEGVEQPVKESTRKREAYFLQYAESVRRVTNVPLGVTGGFRSTEGMEAAIESNATDMIGMARPLIMMPDLPKQVLCDNSFIIEFNEPTTGFESVDRSTALALTWYERQMERIAKGKKPKFNMSAWGTILALFWTLGTRGAAQRRA